MMKRNLPARFSLKVLAGLLAACALFGVVHTPSASAAGAALSQPSVSCSGANATVAFQWQQISGATAQYLDLSIQDDSFVRDSFAGTPVTGSSFTWSGLQAGSIHWWRINTNTSAGWQPSATGMFVPWQPVQRYRARRERPGRPVQGRRADPVGRELLQVEQHQDQRPLLLPYQPAAERRHLEGQPGQVVYSPLRR